MRAPSTSAQASRTRAAARAVLVALVVLSAAGARAHVVVVPAESEAGGWDRYAVLVPTEKPSATVRIELTLPPGMEIIAVEAEPGWEGRHEPFPIGAARLEWRGGRIPPGQFVSFEFMAWNPPAARTISWRATQWYEDGSSDRWSDEKGAGGHGSTTRLRPGSGRAHPQRHGEHP